MGRSQANLHFGIFDGLLGLSLEAKLLYFRLLVEDTVNQAGIGALRMSLWARKIELSQGATEKALQELDENRFVFVDYDTEQILIRTLIRRDGVADVPNVLWAACRAALQLQSPRLRRELAAELRKLPPKPADKVNEKTGRSYVYPDPHGTADAIDPGPDSTPGSHPTSHREPIDEISSASHPDPISNGDPISHPIDMCSRTPGGGGGGGGGGETPVGTNSTSKTKSSRSNRTSERNSGDGFEEFWSAYPNKVGKIKARTVYARAIRNGAEPADLLSGARRYARWLHAAGKQDYAAHPTTWLNRGSWDDELTEPNTGADLRLVAGQTRVPTTTQRVQAALSLLDPEEPA